MKKIIIIMALAILAISCGKEGANPSENFDDCWRVTRVSTLSFVDPSNGQITSRLSTIYLYKPATDLMPQQTKKVKQYNSSYRKGDWYCE